MALTAWGQEEKAKREAWNEIGSLKREVKQLEVKLEVAKQALLYADATDVYREFLSERDLSDD